MAIKSRVLEFRDLEFGFQSGSVVWILLFVSLCLCMIAVFCSLHTYRVFGLGTKSVSAVLPGLRFEDLAFGVCDGEGLPRYVQGSWMGSYMWGETYCTELRAKGFRRAVPEWPEQNRASGLPTGKKQSRKT